MCGILFSLFIFHRHSHDFGGMNIGLQLDVKNILSEPRTFDEKQNIYKHSLKIIVSEQIKLILWLFPSDWTEK